MFDRPPLSLLLIVLAVAPALAEQTDKKPAQVKVAAVQILGYDKTDVPSPCR